MSIELPEDVLLAEFKPCIFFHEGIKITEFVMEDTAAVWQPLVPGKHHFVDLAYEMGTDRLVGIKIWKDVRKPNPGE